MRNIKLLITIPCYNEEIVLEKTVFSLLEYAKEHLADYDWCLLILDNNSSDTTWSIANKLMSHNPERILIDQVKMPARGRALRESWGGHPGFDVYSYMDADLATDIKDFAYLVSKVLDGYDIVAGSRYIPSADVKRDFRRRFLSNIYNILIRMVLGAKFRDAQCGFKAFSKRVVKDLVPETVDNGWFWDTEIMLLAPRGGFKILEVPISWREVRDELRVSKVSPLQEILRQLKNIYIMRKRLNNG